MHSVWVGNNDPSISGWECTSKNCGGGHSVFILVRNPCIRTFAVFPKNPSKFDSRNFCFFDLTHTKEGFF